MTAMLRPARRRRSRPPLPTRRAAATAAASAQRCGNERPALPCPARRGPLPSAGSPQRPPGTRGGERSGGHRYQPRPPRRAPGAGAVWQPAGGVGCPHGPGLDGGSAASRRAAGARRWVLAGKGGAGAPPRQSKAKLAETRLNGLLWLNRWSRSREGRRSRTCGRQVLKPFVDRYSGCEALVAPYFTQKKEAQSNRFWLEFSSR